MRHHEPATRAMSRRCVRRLLPAAVFGIIFCVGAVHGGAQAPAAGRKYTGPRTPDGKPNLNGIWQTMTTAQWDLEAHSAADGMPAGVSLVEGETIPYKPEALAKKKENLANREKLDPLNKCYLPGVPRITFIPFPFQVTQTPKYIVMNFEYQHATRIIYMDSPHAPPNDFWMGDSRGRWDGDTLVVDVTHFNDSTWFDKAGNHHSDALHVIERYTPLEAGHVMHYEATIEDPNVFTRPWKINLPIYRRAEQNMQLLDYDCVDFFWKQIRSSR